MKKKVMKMLAAGMGLIMLCITMTGKMSLEVDETESQLEITVEDENGSYKKHFIGLSDNVTYTVEDVTDNYVDNYHYTLNFNPKMWLPYDIETVD